MNLHELALHMRLTYLCGSQFICFKVPATRRDARRHLLCFLPSYDRTWRDVFARAHCDKLPGWNGNSFSVYHPSPHYIRATYIRAGKIHTLPLDAASVVSCLCVRERVLLASQPSPTLRIQAHCMGFPRACVSVAATSSPHM